MLRRARRAPRDMKLQEKVSLLEVQKCNAKLATFRALVHQNKKCCETVRRRVLIFYFFVQKERNPDNHACYC